MTKYFDEFTKLKQKEMSKTLEDITYKYINPETHQPTKVPASHFDKEFNREIERQISAGVNRQMLMIMYSTIADLKNNSPELFTKAMICLDNGITPKDMRLDEQIALSETYKEFEEVINPPRKSKNNTFHLLNNDINNSYERLKNSPEEQAEMMQMYNQFLDQEDNDLENAKKETDAISENKEDDFEMEI